MNVLLLGSGGREHALAWKISKSKALYQLYIAPGNAGTIETGVNVDIVANDFKGIGQFAIDNKIDMVIVGPEEPLVKGIKDYFADNPRLRDIIVIGPSKKAAQLEGSKEFAKQFMHDNNVPTAKYISVTSDTIEEGRNFLSKTKPPYVLKADGLAAGKGVLILDNQEDARKNLREMLDGKFGAASKKVVIEEYLSGIELSVFVLTDGESYVILPEAKDYKRIGEGDTGLNTGGMGAISPVPFADNKFMKKVEDRIIKPTIHGLKHSGADYTGFIFIGLMKVKDDPYVIEYNIRMGDPEAEVVVPRLDCDLLEVLADVAGKKLSASKIAIRPETAATVMLVSGGYPGAYEKDKEITGIENTRGSIVFHAGTMKNTSSVVTNGGRVISITSLGPDMKSALETCYKNAENIKFDGKYYRKDIGFDLE